MPLGVSGRPKNDYAADQGLGLRPVVRVGLPRSCREVPSSAVQVAWVSER